MANIKKRFRRRLFFALTSVFILTACLWFFFQYLPHRYMIYTDDAYVHGNIVPVMPRVAGTVTQILAQETQKVEQGQLLVKLDPHDQALAFNNAKTNLAVTVREVKQDFDNYYALKDRVELNKAKLDNATIDLERRKKLVEEKQVSEAELQHYRTKVLTAKADYKMAQEKLLTARSYIINTTIYKHPKVIQAIDQVKQSFLNLKRTNIRAPVSGVVANRDVQLGQQVNQNTTLMAIIPTMQKWVDANYKESQLERIRVNQPVTMQSDEYGDVVFHGKVVGLSAGTGSAFSVLPPENATGNWIKILQRLPVRISLDQKDLQKHPLHIGLSMEVTIDTTDTNKPALTVVRPEKVIYGTDIYLNELNQVQTIIENILKKNAPNLSFDKIDRVGEKP